jgi:hypothetical protein
MASCISIVKKPECISYHMCRYIRYIFRLCTNWTVRAARRWVQRLLLLLLQPRWETKRLLTGAARDATALIPWRAAGDNGQFHLLLWLHCVCLSGRCIDARIPTINAISFFILLSCFCCMRREMRFEKFSFVSSRAAAKLRPL